MIFYVAGSSANIERSERVMTALREQGHEVVHDWCKLVREAGEANPGNATREQRCEWSKDCLRQTRLVMFGAARSRYVLVLLHDDKASGSLVEFGFAIRDPWCETIFVGDETRVIFSALADEIFADDEAFLNWAKEQVK